MRRVLVATSLALCYLLLAGNATAELPSTAQDVMNNCRRPTSNTPPARQVASLTCIGFVAGVRSALPIIAPDGTYCEPAGLKFESVLRVVLRWIEENPKSLAAPAEVAVIRALLNAFSCSGAQDR